MNLKKQLLEAKKSCQMYSLFTMDDLEEGHTGFVLQVDENEILIRMINNDGSEGGYYLGKTNDIICCRRSDMELQRRQKLWKEEEEAPFLMEGEGMMSALLQYAMENKELISVCYREQEYFGWISYFTDEILVMDECTYYGESDGKVWLRKEEIHGIAIESYELRIRKKLKDFECRELTGKNGKDFYENLKAYEGKGKLFEFYIEDDLDKFYVGEVAYVTKEELVIKAVDCNGDADGYVLFALEELRCIYEESKYLLKMDRIKKKDTEENLLQMQGRVLGEEFLMYIKNHQCLVMLDVEGECYCGKIEGYDENHICLAAVDEYGAADGQIWVLREWVKTIGIYSNKLKSLC